MCRVSKSVAVNPSHAHRTDDARLIVIEQQSVVMSVTYLNRLPYQVRSLLTDGQFL